MYERDSGIARFYYDKDDLFDACSLKSSYISRSMKGQEGEYRGEEFALSQDENDAFEKCVEKCSLELWGTLSKMCPDDNAFGWEEEIFVTLKDGGCPEKTLIAVNRILRDVIIEGILKEWFLFCGESKLSDYCLQVYRQNLKLLWSEMFRMRNRIEG